MPVANPDQAQPQTARLAVGKLLEFVKGVYPPRRLLTVFLCCSVVALIFGTDWQTSLQGLWVRVFGIGFILLLVFGTLERWPRRLPRRIARWALQVTGVGLSVPICTTVLYILSTPSGAPPFWEVEARLNGFGLLTFGGVLLAPWVALSALVRQREARVSELSFAVQLQKSELERRGLEARMNLLSAQVKPHFLFNTLANVHALVATDSPRASQVLESLIAYLRAAVPKLDAGSGTLGEELSLVRAYLDLMRVRMPDRLQVAWTIEPGLENLCCPPLTVLTLVENAVRHGIDPSEVGGTLSISVRVRNDVCHITVEDNGVGISPTSNGLGTGISALRERLQLTFKQHVQVELSAAEPQGAKAKLIFPAMWKAL